MSWQPSLQSILCDAMRNIAGDHASAKAATAISLVIDLVEALPQDASTIVSLHRSGIKTMVETSLPATPIQVAAHIGSGATYEYAGPHATYREAFFGCAGSHAGGTPFNEMFDWEYPQSQCLLERLAIAALTDAILRYVPSPYIEIDSMILTDDLRRDNAALIPVLTAGYTAILSHIYGPTSMSFTALCRNSDPAMACRLLKAGLLDLRFINAMAAAQCTGQAQKARWLLFNIWVLLKSLGEPAIHARIQWLQEQGLPLPAPLGPRVWWNAYAEWFPPIDGGDLFPAAQTRLLAPLPVRIRIPGDHVTRIIDEPYGYARSFVEWNPHNPYCRRTDAWRG